MRRTAILAAIALLIASPGSPQETPRAAVRTSPEQTARDLDQKAAALAATIDALTVKTDALAARIDLLVDRIEALVARVEATRPQPKPVPQHGGECAASPTNPDPKSLYDAAYNDYLKGNYDLAERGLQEYVSICPDSNLTDNAQYWIAEVHYRQQRYRQALDQFEVVLKRYPRSDKAAAAHLKTGLAHLALGQRSQGVSKLRQVIRQYPKSDEAVVARQRLRELGLR